MLAQHFADFEVGGNRVVRLQMTHLRTHPSVAGGLAERSLTVHGWVYDIGQGDVRIHDAGSGRFVPIDGFAVSSAGQEAWPVPAGGRR